MKYTYNCKFTLKWFQLMAAIIALICFICILGNLIVLLYFLTLPGFLDIVARQAGRWGMVALGVGGAGSLAVLSFMTFYCCRFIISTPSEIILNENGLINFITLNRTITISVTDIKSINLNKFLDPWKYVVTIRCKQGDVRLWNTFADFNKFIEQVTAMNPSVEVRGFG